MFSSKKMLMTKRQEICSVWSPRHYNEVSLSSHITHPYHHPTGICKGRAFVSLKWWLKILAVLGTGGFIIFSPSPSFWDTLTTPSGWHSALTVCLRACNFIWDCSIFPTNTGAKHLHPLHHLSPENQDSQFALSFATSPRPPRILLTGIRLLW